MSLRVRMLVTMGSALLIIAALGADLVVTYRVARSSLDDVLQTLTPAASASSRLDAAINTMDRTLSAYATSEVAAQRTLHEAARESAQEDLAELEGLLGNQEPYDSQITEVSDSLTTWTTRVADPVLAAVDDGQTAQAQELLASEDAQEALLDMNSSAARLHGSITKGQTAGTLKAQGAARDLVITLIVALVVLLLLPPLMFLVLGAAVLRPIYRLRAQLRRAADPAHREEAISVAGPKEVRELGADAEALRRALVAEIDQASAARDALQQEGPVVAAIHAELAAGLDDSGRESGPEVQGVLRPAEGVLAGDFWDLVPLSDGRTAIVVCDVSGHGPSAGIVALRLKTTIRLGLASGEDASTMLGRACDAFATEPAMFATVVILVVDPGGELSWVSAGHPSVRLLAGADRVESLPATGPMISWLGGAWQTRKVAFSGEDSLVAFSDGLLESRDHGGTELGDDGLDELLRRFRRQPPGELVELVLAAARQRSGDLSRDDVTIVVARAERSRVRPSRLIRPLRAPNR